MSYNIDKFKVKKINNLTMPLSALTETLVFREHPEVKLIAEEGRLVISGGCHQEIHAIKLDEDRIQIVAFENMRSDGSGHFYEDCLKVALRQSSGELEVVTVWEGGDSICRLTCKDGALTEEQVEL